MDRNPENVGSNYAVALANPPSVSGQTLSDAVRWQVAMLSLQCACKFYNFGQTRTLRFVVDRPSDANIGASKTASSDCRDTEASFATENFEWNRLLLGVPAIHWILKH